MDTQAVAKQSAQKEGVEPETEAWFDGKKLWTKIVRAEREKLWIFTFFTIAGLVTLMVMAYYAARYFGE